MSCTRHTEIDLAAYAADPRDGAFEAFREHFPGCETCAPIVAEWLALRDELATLDAEAAHPAPEVLAAFAESAAVAERASIEAHLAACGACRTELRVLQTFERPALAAPIAQATLAPSFVDRLRDLMQAWMPAPALAGIALVLIAMPVGWALWRAAPETTRETTIAAREPVAEADGPEEFAAAPPGEPETRVAAAGSEGDAIPDDDPTFDADNPLELGFNDKGFPGFSEKELAGMPEPSLALEPMDLGGSLPSEAVVADAGESSALEPSEPEVALAVEPEVRPDLEPAAEVAQTAPPPITEPIRIAALLPSELPQYVPSAALAGGSLASLRLDSAVRGAQGTLPRVQAMAPDHVAAVESASPKLYWWLSSESPVPVEVTLVARESGDTLFEQRIAAPVRAGLHAFDPGVRLPAGLVVEWYVALVVDESRRELDAVSNAALRFVRPAAPLAAEPGREAHVRAAAGYWIDAFAQLTRWIEAEPDAAPLRAHRAALASQAGLEAP